MASIRQQAIQPEKSYLQFLQDTLTQITQMQETKFSDEKVQEIAKDFSLLISPPSHLRHHYYHLILNANLLDEVNNACIFFQKFQEELRNGSLKKALEWYSFKPLTEKPWMQELSTFPINMSQQKFKIVLTPENPYAYWNHLTTRLCSATSPSGIDRFAETIANDLKNEEHVVLINFGAGGCLPTLPIVSRLIHMKQIDLFLVDPTYPTYSHRSYCVQHDFVAEFGGAPPLTDTPNDLAVMEFMGICGMRLPLECTLHVHVIGSVDQIQKYKLEEEQALSSHVLFAVDPEPMAAKDFQKAVHFLASKKSSYYCLNEFAGVNGRLTQKEALNTDRIFRRIPTSYKESLKG